MNGARALVGTLLAGGVRVCFANPGTSEMHVVAALDEVPEMRAVLGLFEGVVTGAADGYGRMADRPAATLLHLGPGLANGWANLHNARRAHSPVLNVVGDHATYHGRYDPALQSDIGAVAGAVSAWVRHPTTVGEVGPATAEAITAAAGPPGRIATLIMPADLAWSEGAEAAEPTAAAPRAAVTDAAVTSAAAALRSGERAVILLGGEAMREPGLVAASRVAAATGAAVIGETFPARWRRGAGLPAVERLPYLAEMTAAQLADVRHLVLAGAPSPVAFFAYPDVPSDLVPEGCRVHVLAGPADDVTGALEHLADVVAPGIAPPRQPPRRPEAPTGELSLQSLADVVGALLPEEAIVVDEANTSGLMVPGATAGAPPHDWLTLTGGAIGQGLPLALGAAVACPDRPVIALVADGSAMYTISALWSFAREGLDITTVVLDNRAYAILGLELSRVGAVAAGSTAASLLDLSRPDLDFAAIAAGMGVPASRARSAEDLTEQLRKALAEPGPHLIDAIVPALSF